MPSSNVNGESLSLSYIRSSEYGDMFKMLSTSGGEVLLLDCPDEENDVCTTTGGEEGIQSGGRLNREQNAQDKS